MNLKKEIAQMRAEDIYKMRMRVYGIFRILYKYPVRNMRRTIKILSKLEGEIMYATYMKNTEKKHKEIKIWNCKDCRAWLLLGLTAGFLLTAILAGFR